ncbi:LOW QUALITY PROTEIN: cytokine receptor common subunit beta [Brachyistius frenatus]|uniref:LOW QUALITY PROTEIN: cytokine receptor common subunit beta n=1 Tax=Brachyistius frenatus TaxID=100188 RepID=UPI0037E8BC3A
MSHFFIISRMMSLFWVLLWSVLPDLALFSGPDRCAIYESSSSQRVSPLLKSLQCHNDYESHVHCKWRKHRNTTLELWFETENDRKLCTPHPVAEHRMVHCKYKTRTFSIGIKHTVFFLKNETLSLCSSVPNKSLDLFQHLKARPPLNLSTHDAGDGGRRLRWSSPYPSFSSLNRNLTYQLSYRTHREDNWITLDVANTSLKLERRLLLPGRRYEGRVRARASVGQWSDWSPVVTWQNKEDFGQVPALHCVLDGEREVMCSWEVSRELAHFFTYQLACRYNQTAPSETCCVNPTVSSDLSETVLTYSCSLTVTDPQRLLLDLRPTHNAKTFKANLHIRPHPPRKVKTREKDGNWIVEWTKPASKLRLSYQVCYYWLHDQGSSVLLNISEASMSVTILGKSLLPLQYYQVMVRSLVVPGEGSYYEGIPSAWTDPVNWTTNEATWPFSALIYILISMFVTTIFLTLYCTIPACQRKVILWVESVPSPGKSKILSEIKSATTQTFMQNEKMSICKVQHLDSTTTSSSSTFLWPTKDNEKSVDEDEGCWNSDNLPSTVEKVDSSETSFMSFSGPYILCQPSDPTPKTVEIKSEEKDQESPSDVSVPPFPVTFTLFGEGYVCLPRHSVSRSTQDLVSHSDNNTSTHSHDSAELDQQGPESMLGSGFSEPTTWDQPPEFTSGPFSPWPQGDTIQASGYCHLPTAFITTAK